METFIRNSRIADEQTRSSLVKALLEAMQQGKDQICLEEKSIQHLLPSLQQILKNPGVKQLLHDKEPMSHLATGSILRFLDQSQATLDELGHPFQADEHLWKGFEAAKEDWFPSNWPSIASLMRQHYLSEEIDPPFYEETAHQLRKKASAPLQQQALRTMLLQDWETVIQDKRIRFQADRMKEWVRAFIQQLLQQLQSWEELAGILKEMQEMLGPLWEDAFNQCLSSCTCQGKDEPSEILSALQRLCQGGPGEKTSMGKKLLQGLLDEKLNQETSEKQESHNPNGWGPGSGNWSKSGLLRLIELEKKLQGDKALQELAEQIGRGSGRGRPREVFTDGQQQLSFQGSQFKGAQKGSITGSRESNDLLSLFPAELALFSEADTEAVFFKKLAEHRLQTYAFQSQLFGDDGMSIAASPRKGEADQNGPIIICLDTSGSMQGPREEYAKLVSYALARIALEEGRLCRIISFSRHTQTIDIDKQQPIDNFLKFLEHSFHGGTDPTRALHTTVKTMQHKNYRWADLLMISDFEMHPLHTRTREEMKKARAAGNLFLALKTDGQVSEWMSQTFDKVWLTDVYRKDSKLEEVSSP